jgi:hypothetical protein
MDRHEAKDNKDKAHKSDSNRGSYSHRIGISSINRVVD